MNISSRQFQVMYRRDADGTFIATVPSLPGCHTQGKTIEQAEERIREATQAFLESMKAHGEPIPPVDDIFLGSVLVPAV